jgi:molybdopterin converting factor small subunit
MRIRVLFFGATADVSKCREMDVALENGRTAGDVFNSVVNQHPRLRDHKLLYSINQEFASGDETVRDGDELAIFTAVSGG